MLKKLFFHSKFVTLCDTLRHFFPLFSQSRATSPSSDVIVVSHKDWQQPYAKLR